MADQHAPQGLEFIGEFSQDIRKDNGCRTGNLNDTLMQGDLGVEGRGAVAHAIRPTIAVSIMSPTCISTTSEMTPVCAK